MRMAVFPLLASFAVAAPVSAERLGADLCAFAIDGLTLESSKAEAAAVFSKRGWNDLSTPRSVKANGAPTERIEFDRTRKSDAPDEIKADKDGPVGRFQLIRDEAGNKSLRLSDYAATPPADRARALCADAIGRYEVSGCEERFLSRDVFGVIIRPRTIIASEAHCTVSFDGANSHYGQTYTLSVVKRTGAGRAQTGRRKPRQ